MSRTAKGVTRGYCALIIVIAIILGVAIYENDKGKGYRISLENTYENAYGEVYKAVNSIDASFSKLEVLDRLKDKVTTFVDIYRISNTAKENLDTLPYSHSSISNVSKYLTQVSDFSYNIISKGVNGYELTNEDNEVIANFSKYGNTLYTNLEKIRQDIEDGNGIEWDKINSDNSGEKIATSAYGSMANVQTDFEEYPSVTYDGPFSDHIEKMEPEHLKGKEEVSQEEARDIARSIIDDTNVKSIKLAYEVAEDENNTIPAYRFEVTLVDKDEASIMIDISKRGGVPLWMLDYAESNTKVLTNKASSDETEKVAREYVKRLGFDNMNVSYHEATDRHITYNFNYTIDDIIVYADMIKVKVSLEDKSIVGFETLGYVMMHKDRNIESATITLDEARGVCSQNFMISRIRRALIPQSSMKEVLTYEVTGKLNEKEYVVYVNAMTGGVEKIIQIIRQDNGVFERN